MSVGSCFVVVWLLDEVGDTELGCCEAWDATSTSEVIRA